MASTTSKLTQARLWELLEYIPQTGEFFWRVSHGTKKKDSRAGYMKKSDGYYRVTVDRKTYLLHRLAWLYCYGSWPIDQIDHRNGNRDDNRISNLRMADHTTNQHNAHRRRDNKSGKSGVCWVRAQQRWRAYIRVNRKYRHLGLFVRIQDAIAARLQAEQIYQSFRYVKA